MREIAPFDGFAGLNGHLQDFFSKKIGEMNALHVRRVVDLECAKSGYHDRVIDNRRGFFLRINGTDGNAGIQGGAVKRNNDNLAAVLVVSQVILFFNVYKTGQKTPGF
jgi:hypothetical protein